MIFGELCVPYYFFVVFFALTAFLAVFFVVVSTIFCALSAFFAFSAVVPISIVLLISESVNAICEDLFIIGNALPRDIGRRLFNFGPSSTVILVTNKFDSSVICKSCFAEA